MTDAHLAVWCVAVLATAGVILRPWKLPEAIWALGGAGLLVACGLLSPQAALHGVGKGLDVYLFLTGMMLLSETARQEGLFDWLAAHAARRAKGSAGRLFLLVYGVGTVVTMFLSNDATAVVLTPAVAAAMRAAKVDKPLPYLLVCAFIANAASFVLPISNPANLVIYAGHMPPLAHWLRLYALPSLLSIAATCAALYWTQRRALMQHVASDIAVPRLPRSGRIAAAGIGVTALLLLAASALAWPLGLATAVMGGLTALIVLLVERKNPLRLLRDISWSVLPLVAGLFVLVEALGQTGLIGQLSQALNTGALHSANAAAWLAGGGIAVATNLMNNLPAGLIAGGVAQGTVVPSKVTSALLIGVDLGPNLSVTGSLATILWLTALRREGLTVGAGEFLRLGALIMPLALVLALGAALLF